MSTLKGFNQIRFAGQLDKVEDVRCFVAPALDLPMLAPITFQLRCPAPRGTERCNACQLHNQTVQEYNTGYSQESDQWLRWINLTADQTQGKIKREITFTPDCHIDWYEGVSTTLSAVKLISTNEKDQPISALSTVKNFNNGELYDVSGTLMKDWRGRLIFVIFAAKRVKPSFENYKIPPKLHTRLVKRFAGKSIKRIIEERAKILEAATTIVNRRALHVAALLLWHSRLNIKWRGFLLGRGTLDVLIIGDRGTGKSTLFENLIHYFGEGELASGELVTLPGLMASTAKDNNGQFTPIPGKFAKENQKLVIVDEAHDFIGTPDFQKTSRWRSSGKIQLNKANSNITYNAQVRVGWICNPVNGKSVPLQPAIMRLVKTAEDRRRFDYAISVSNEKVTGRPKKADFTHQEEDQALVLHTWSKSNPVEIEEELIDQITDTATNLEQTLSKTFPELINVGSTEEKVLRVSAAVAEACFREEIDEECIEFAQEWFENLLLNQKEGRKNK